MKRKKVLLTEPTKTKKKGKVITVQQADEILILNIYQECILQKRYCMNINTGEYEAWDAKTCEWKIEKAYVAAGGNIWYDSGLSMEKKISYDPPKARDKISELLKDRYWSSWPKGLELLDKIEQEYNSDKREKKEERRMERERQLAARVPDIPEDFKGWVLQTAGRGEHYLFWDKEAGEYTCTACGNKVSGLPGKHNDQTECPVCGAKAQIKRRQKSIERREKVCLMQDMGADRSVCRHFDVRICWEASGEYVRLSEAVRIMPLRKDARYDCQIRYNQYTRNSTSQDWDKHNPANRRTGKCYLYPAGIQGCLAGTAYASLAGIMEWMAKQGMVLDYNRLMAGAGTRVENVVEYLAKGRFYRLLDEMIDSIDFLFRTYRSELDMYGETAREVLGLEDAQHINRLRDANGGKDMLLWLRWSEETGQKLPQEALSWALEEGVGRYDLPENMSLTRFMHYIRRQQAESYPGKKTREVIEQYRDYRNMCQRLGKDLSDEMVSRPRELKRRHDELVEEIRQQNIMDDLTKNRERWEAEAEKMAKEYPGAEENLAEVRQIYEYTGEEYMVVVPKRLVEIAVEGNALHHCAGSSSRYFERIKSKETYIFFLRKVSAPDTPYYTLEVEPGGTIRQNRTYLDEETGIEQVRGFLKEWQQAIKKRLTAAEKEAAKVSAVKRQQNLEELRQKNNTRVLNALLEDFMEAV